MTCNLLCVFVMFHNDFLLISFSRMLRFMNIEFNIVVGHVDLKVTY